MSHTQFLGAAYPPSPPSPSLKARRRSISGREGENTDGATDNRTPLPPNNSDNLYTSLSFLFLIFESKKRLELPGATNHPGRHTQANSLPFFWSSLRFSLSLLCVSFIHDIPASLARQALKGGRKGEGLHPTDMKRPLQRNRPFHWLGCVKVTDGGVIVNGG